MSRCTTARTLLPLATAALLAACAASALPANAAATPPAAAPTLSMSTASPAATTAPRIRSLTVPVSKGIVSLPSRLPAGTYYVHLTTTDADAALQVVRPPANLSLATWYARWLACARPSPGTAFDLVLRRCAYWRTSATFVGGADLVRTHVPGSSAILNPGGRATFALTLSPGRYWLYASRTEVPLSDRGSRLPIRTLTVVGPPARAAVPVAAVARFVGAGVTVPRVIPRRGFVLGIGRPGIVSFLGLLRLKPGVTDEQLFTSGQCFADGAVTRTLDCFANPSSVALGGGVSGGSSALWWYDLPPGDYVAYQGGRNQYGDTGLSPSAVVTRVTVT